MKFFILTWMFSLQALALETSISPGTLANALKEKNAKVSSARLQAESAQLRTGFLTRSFLPSLDLYAGQDSFKQGSQELKNQPVYGAELRFNLFNGGADRLENKMRELEVTRLDYQAQKTLAEELLKARQLYWNLTYLTKKKELLTNASDLNNGNLNGALKRIRSGVATDSDRFEFEMKAVDLKRDATEVDMEIKNLSAQLNVLLDLPAENTFKLNQELGHEHDFMAELNVDETNSAFWFMGEQTSAEQKVLSAQQTGRALWPQLEAFAAYNQYNEREKEFLDESERRETVVGLRVRLSLAHGLTSLQDSSAFRKQAIAEQYASDFQKKSYAVTLANEKRTLSFLHDQVHEAEENISRAERYYKLTQSEYARGVKNSPDVLGAADKLYQRREKYYEILRDFQVARSEALAVLGK